MKKTKFFLGVLAAATLGVVSASTNADVVNVSQDGWIDFNDGTVKDSGTGVRLNVATPNPSGASQYSRTAYFGFDVSGLDLSQVTDVTFNATTASDILAGYDGQDAYRFTLVDNTILDSFDQTTLTDGNAPGHTNGNVITTLTTAGTIVGDVAVAGPAASQAISMTFSAASLADLANDTNGWLTVVAEYRGQNNAGYGAFTGLGFNSLESGSGANLDLTLNAVPEPSSLMFIGFGAVVLATRRRRG